MGICTTAKTGKRPTALGKHPLCNGTCPGVELASCHLAIESFSSFFNLSLLEQAMSGRRQQQQQQQQQAKKQTKREKKRHEEEEDTGRIKRTPHHRQWNSTTSPHNIPTRFGRVTTFAELIPVGSADAEKCFKFEMLCKFLAQVGITPKHTMPGPMREDEYVEEEMDVEMEAEEEEEEEEEGEAGEDGDWMQMGETTTPKRGRGRGRRKNSSVAPTAGTQTSSVESNGKVATIRVSDNIVAAFAGTTGWNHLRFGFVIHGDVAVYICSNNPHGPRPYITISKDFTLHPTALMDYYYLPPAILFLELCLQQICGIGSLSIENIPTDALASVLETMPRLPSRPPAVPPPPQRAFSWSSIHSTHVPNDRPLDLDPMFISGDQSMGKEDTDPDALVLMQEGWTGGHLSAHYYKPLYEWDVEFAAALERNEQEWMDWWAACITHINEFTKDFCWMKINPEKIRKPTGDPTSALRRQKIGLDALAANLQAADGTDLYVYREEEIHPNVILRFLTPNSQGGVPGHEVPFNQQTTITLRGFVTVPRYDAAWMHLERIALLVDAFNPQFPPVIPGI